MATPQDSDPKKEVEPVEETPPTEGGGTDSGGGAGGTGTDSTIPTRDELAGALGVDPNDPKVDEALGGLKFQEMMKDQQRQVEASRAAERAAAEAAAKEAAAKEAAANQITNEYDDPFTGAHVVETIPKPPEWSSPLAASEARIMQETQELIKNGLTREKLETEGYSTTTTVQIGDLEATTVKTARPDGRIETIQTIVDADGDGKRTTMVRESLTGSGISIVEEKLDDGKSVGSTVIRQEPGAGGTVPVVGPNTPRPPEMPDISQADADAFVDALNPNGPTTDAGKDLLDGVGKQFGLDPNGTGNTGGAPDLTVPGNTVPMPDGIRLPGSTGLGSLPGQQPGKGQGGTSREMGGGGTGTGGGTGSGTGAGEGSGTGGGKGAGGMDPGDRPMHEPSPGAGSGGSSSGSTGGRQTEPGGSAGQAPPASGSSGSGLGADIDAALGNLGSGSAPQPDSVGAQGSRGSEPSAGTGLSIGPLDTQSHANDDPASQTPTDSEGGDGIEFGGSTITATQGQGSTAINHTEQGNVKLTEKSMEQLAEERERDEAQQKADAEKAEKEKEAEKDDSPDDAGDDGMRDPDADTGVFQLGDRLSNIEITSGGVFDGRFTNTGNGDGPNTPDLSTPPDTSTPGGETPQGDTMDFEVLEVQLDRIPGFGITTVRPELTERLPTLDPSTLSPQGSDDVALGGDEGFAAPGDDGGFAFQAPTQFGAMEYSPVDMGFNAVGFDDQGASSFQDPTLAGPGGQGFDQEMDAGLDTGDGGPLPFP